MLLFMRLRDIVLSLCRPLIRLAICLAPLFSILLKPKSILNEISLVNLESTLVRISKFSILFSEKFRSILNNRSIFIFSLNL